MPQEDLCLTSETFMALLLHTYYYMCVRLAERSNITRFTVSLSPGFFHLYPISLTQLSSVCVYLCVCAYVCGQLAKQKTDPGHAVPMSVSSFRNQWHVM